MQKTIEGKFLTPQEKYKKDLRYLRKYIITYSICFCCSFFFLIVALFTYATFKETAILLVFSIFVLIGTIVFCLWLYYIRLSFFLKKGDPNKTEQIVIDCLKVRILEENPRRYSAPKNRIIVLYAKADGKKRKFYYIVQNKKLETALHHLLKKRLQGEINVESYLNSPFLYRIEAEGFSFDGL